MNKFNLKYWNVLALTVTGFLVGCAGGSLHIAPPFDQFADACKNGYIGSYYRTQISCPDVNKFNPITDPGNSEGGFGLVVFVESMDADAPRGVNFLQALTNDYRAQEITLHLRTIGNNLLFAHLEYTLVANPGRYRRVYIVRGDTDHQSDLFLHSMRVASLKHERYDVLIWGHSTPGGTAIYTDRSGAKTLSSDSIFNFLKQNTDSNKLRAVFSTLSWTAPANSFRTVADAFRDASTKAVVYSRAGVNYVPFHVDLVAFEKFVQGYSFVDSMNKGIYKATHEWGGNMKGSKKICDISMNDSSCQVLQIPAVRIKSCNGPFCGWKVYKPGFVTLSSEAIANSLPFILVSASGTANVKITDGN